MVKRIIIGVILLLLFVCMLLLGRLAQTVLLTLACVLAVYELERMLKHKGYFPFMLPAYLFSAIYAFLLYYGQSSLCILSWFLCIILIIIERVFNNKRETKDCFAAMAVFIYPLPFFVLLTLLGSQFGQELGVAALLCAFAFPLLGDTFAYFAGTLFGRRKLCPSISPKKTIVGSAASMLGSLAGSTGVFLLQPLLGTQLPIAPLLFLGLLCGVLGQLGDLFASLIKRWADIKDFGTLFPGHGGILDRLDSVLLCAPAVYICFYMLAYMPAM